MLLEFASLTNRIAYLIANDTDINFIGINTIK